jgi:GNAT superfamily N-acetyltransferase
MTWEIRTAQDERTIRRCWPVVRELRRNISGEDEFLDRWKVLREEGYTFVYIEEEGTVVAVGGYWLRDSLALGHFLYLDDLGALSSRHGAGLGAAILAHVQQVALESGCTSVELDTGHHRRAAHRSYLRNGFELDSHHLAWKADQR